MHRMRQLKWGGEERNTTAMGRGAKSNICLLRPTLALLFILILRSGRLATSRRMKAHLWPHGSRRAKSAPHHEGRRHLTAGDADTDGSTRGPRIFASNSAAGQESAGRPYLICIVFTAVRLC